MHLRLIGTLPMLNLTQLAADSLRVYLVTQSRKIIPPPWLENTSAVFCFVLFFLLYFKGFGLFALEDKENGRLRRGFDDKCHQETQEA